MAERKENYSFLSYQESKVKSSSDEVLAKFAKLSDNEARVAYVLSQPGCGVLPWSGKTNSKDAAAALQFKNDGNAAFQKSDFRLALIQYNRACLYAPSEDPESLSIVLANRSACLLHLEDLRRCLWDIEQCLQNGYPQKLRYKVYERRARCLLKMRENDLAMDAFKDMMKAMDYAQLPAAKRQKMVREADLMIKIMTDGKKYTNSEFNKAPKKPKKDKPPPNVSGHLNSTYISGSDFFTIDEDETQGRFAKATKDIPTASMLVVEKPFCYALLEEYSKTHCQHCLKNNISNGTLCFLPCTSCANVVFCSESCRKDALDTYHKHECGILSRLWQSQTSITCHLALRIITQKPVSYFEDLRPDLGKRTAGAYRSDDYRNVYNLVSHETKRNNADLYQRSHMAAYLLNLLKETAYFDEVDSKTVNFVGGLILKNLQILQFNTHEIFELRAAPGEGKVQKKHLGKTFFIGGGLYPTVALFNHSCDPDVTRYFHGTSMVLRTIKPVQKDGSISENYGPLFMRQSTEKRRAKLVEQYWFTCHCIACEQNWPTYENMDNSHLRFRCDSEGACNNVLMVPYTCDNFVMMCTMCKRFTNLMKGLCSVKKTDEMLLVAYKLMDNEKYKDALSKFIEVLNLYNETLAPPYKSFQECQQNIRTCMLTFGNYA